MYSTLVRGLGGLRLAPRESLASSDTRRCFSVAAARQQWNGQRATGGGETIEQHPHTGRRRAHQFFPGYLARHSPTLTCPHQVPVRCFSISTLKFSDLVQAEVAKAASSPAMAAAGGAVGGGGVAGADAAATPTKELILDFLPEKPTPLDPSVLVGEPSFESLGLASWWPSGRLQYFMEHLHITLDFDWYQAIALTALCLRIISFPLVVIAQRNVANMNNNMPGMAVIQEKMTEARQRGDHMETAQYGKELQEYMNKRGINPIKNVFPVLVQLPIFMSMFFGLRSMANLPVPSMEQGGALWFENLAMADPFYLLPILTSGTLYLQIRMGADGNRLDSMGPTGRIFFTVFPFVLVPLTMNFPSAVTFYWLSTNVISCTQAAILRLPAVRSALGIPKLIVWDKSKTPGGKKKGFRESVRESIDNWRVQSDIADRRAMDEAAFREAGSSKAPKTYAYDPTKPVAIKMKKR